MTLLMPLTPILTRPAPESFDQMVADMLKTEQFEEFSVYQHGQSVAECLELLKSYLRGDAKLPESRWKLPDWFLRYGPQIIANLHSESDTQLYAIYHDCGKPYCLEYDEQGRRHFPNHAQVSRFVWDSVGGSDTVGHLIENDMVIHTASSQEIAEKLLVWSREDSLTLLVAALSEIHANAKNFGGIDSTSFKIKFKQVDRRGTQICKFWFGDQPQMGGH